MFIAHLVEKFSRWMPFAAMEFFQSLPDAFVGVELCGDVEEALVGGGVLNDGFGFAVDGEDDGATGLLEALHHFDGVVAEGGEGLDVFGDVDHVRPPSWRYFIVPFDSGEWEGIVKQAGSDSYTPTLRNEAAKDGAPEILWLGKESVIGRAGHPAGGLDSYFPPFAVTAKDGAPELW